MTHVKITILGCGSSSGVPLATGVWEACDPSQPKNRRRRASILIEAAKQIVLVDTGPDLREQLIEAAPVRLDAVLYTHPHADHLHGVDDLRFFVYRQGKVIPAYMDAHTLSEMESRFAYLFPTGAQGKAYPPLLEPHLIPERFSIGGLEIESFAQPHGAIESRGIRVGKFAYSTDCVNLSQETLEKLRAAELDVWIVDATRYDPHPAHAHVDMALEWIAYVQPKQAYLTHLSGALDYDTLVSDLPNHVRPLYDGQIIEVG